MLNVYKHIVHMVDVHLPIEVPEKISIQKLSLKDKVVDDV